MAVLKTIVFVDFALYVAISLYLKHKKENDEALWWMGWAIIWYITLVSYGW